MLTRLTHAGIAFALTVAAYQAYFLIAVPFVEPAGAATPAAQALSIAQLEANNVGVEKYREFLAAYFQPGHWTLDKTLRPIVAENGQAMIVFDSYRQDEKGVLTVPRVVVLFFPHTRDRAAAPPRDAIVLEPERGAMLQMDQTIEGAGALGRMQYGQLLGSVRVRSDMKEPGPQDDLAITTRDLYMNEDLIRTAEPVEMALGEHRARGRGLEIRFTSTESTRGGTAPSAFGKLDTLEISNEVAARIVPKQTTLFGSADASPTAPAGSQASPAEITSAGPFRVDFASHAASFAEQVRVRQRQASGQIDELYAETLTLYFAEMRQWGDETPTSTSDSAFGSVKLEPATVRATGTEDSPVRLIAPSHDATAVGELLTIELIQRLVTLGGGSSVKLTYRGAEMHAPSVQYELPAKDSGSRLGAMAANGDGWLKATPNPARPQEILEVSWDKAMHLVRQEGQPVLVLDGRSKISMLGLGMMWADHLEVLLRETAAAVRDGGQAGALTAGIEAERVVATGHVDIDSAQLNGHVSQLELEIAYPRPAPQGGAANSAVAAGGGAPSSTTPAAAPLFNPNRGAGGPPRSYNITGSMLHLDAVMRDRRPQMTSIHVDDGVVFEETQLQSGGQAPLRILAEHLEVTDADLPDAKIEIRGGDSRAGMAEITSGTTVLRAPALLINRGTSEAWIDSPGEVTMVAAAGSGGQQIAASGPVAVTWRDRMHLKGDRIELFGNVHVQHQDGWLKTQELALVLTEPVRFDGAGGGDRQPEVAQLECWKGVEAEFIQRDAARALTSHQRIEIVSLVVNQVNGKISGDGPGHVDSVHLSKQASAMLALPTAPGAPPSAPTVDPAAPPQLRHLSIDFVRGIEGNLLTREITAVGDVRTVYGPVDSWDQRLAMSIDGRPGPDTIWITCERLTASENPYGRIQTPTAPGQPRPMGPIDLKAAGGVEIELIHPEQGAINLRGQEATYDQLKTMFNLKGSRSAPAVISQQKFPGAQPSEQTAEGWTYFQNTGEIKINSPQGTLFQFDGP